MWKATLALALAGVLGATTAAHAMGTDVSYELVAWSADGSSALLRRATFWDGEQTVAYVVIGAADREPIEQHAGLLVRVRKPVDLDSTLSIDDCVAAARALAHDLATHQIRGVTVTTDRCAMDDDPVDVDAATKRATAATILPDRDRAVAELVAQYGEPPTIPPADCMREACTAVVVATTGGALELAFVTPGGGSPSRTTVHVLARAQAAQPYTSRGELH